MAGAGVWGGRRAVSFATLQKGPVLVAPNGMPRVACPWIVRLPSSGKGTSAVRFADEARSAAVGDDLLYIV